jgi:formyltetrahydrofolate deformylase
MTMDCILNLSCPDKVGLVRTVADWLFGRDCNIIDSDQFGDPSSRTFFMRVHFSGAETLDVLRTSFESVASANHMTWNIWSASQKPNVLIMVSKLDHCLVDLLYRTRIGELPINIPLIVSNHRDTYSLAAAQDIDFQHLAINSDNKPQQERRLLEEIQQRDIDFVVLARYMQVLSSDFCRQMSGRVINIHHSFLPSFKGAKPYHQAFDRGVKLIGATAHYITENLDEGPIIEQGVERVDHRMGSKELVAAGRDVERIVLSKAVRYQAERRILLNGHRTVVFQ